MARPADANPYVGPRPFERDDAPRFFGRAREVRDVVSLVVAQRVVLLYSASGAGKTSLLNAGVLPTLESEKNADALPVARVRAEQPPTGRNAFAFALVVSLAEDEATDAALVDFLAELPRPSPQRLRVLVVDQFEELFTAYAERWQERSGLFDELRAALESDPALRVVLSIREDFVAQLDPFAIALPGRLGTRFRLERLDRASALAAVKNPIAETKRSLGPGVAEALVSDLLRFRVETGAGSPTEVEGEFVEPVQLQVVCTSLWSELPDAVDEITEEHLRTFGNVDDVLAQFYDESIQAAAAAGDVGESRLRRMVEQAFITSVGTRGTAYRTEATTGDIPNTAIDELEDRHLVRAEARAFARWYELTHDRLIEPIRESNARYLGRVKRRRARRAAWLVAALLAAGLITGLALWTSGTGASTRADVSPPTFIRNTLIASGGAHSPRTFIVETQISVAGVGNQTLTARFSEHDANTGATLFQPAQLKLKVTGDLTNFTRQVSLPVPTNVTGFFVRATVVDREGRELDEAKSDVLALGVRGRVRPPTKRAAAPVIASFSVSRTGDGTVTSSPAGIACGDKCSATYAVGEAIKLTATPGNGARFAGWRGGCTGVSPSCRVPIREATEVEASFVPLEVQPVTGRGCGRVEYQGLGPVDALIVSDLPLSGTDRTETKAAEATIRAVIAGRKWRAGKLSVAYQSCDNRAQTAVCARNGAAYGADAHVLAIVGMSDARCALAELRTLKGTALVSAGVSELCLTEQTRLCELDPRHPFRPYPNFARVVPDSADQAVALAEYARENGIKCAGVIDDGSHYGATLARVFNMVGRSLGVVCAASAWPQGQGSYRQVMEFLNGKNVDAVFAAGEPGPSAARMIRDKVAVLGANDGAVKLLAPASLASKSVARQARGDTAGMLVGSIFAERGHRVAARTGVGQYPSSSYAAAATEVVLAAIARAGRDRAAIVHALRGAKIRSGALGPFRIDARGDPAPARTAGTSTRVPLGIQIEVATRSTFKPVAVVKPLECLVRYALDAKSDDARAPADCHP